MADSVMGNMILKLTTKMDQSSLNAAKATVSGLKGFAMKALGAVGIAFTLSGAKQFIQETASIQAEVKSTNTQFSQTFGDMTKTAENSLKKVSDATGISEMRIKSSYARMASFAKTGGMSSAEANDFTARSMKALADNAAYMDKSIEVTQDTFQKLLKGNFQLDDNMNFNLSEKERNAMALEKYNKKYKDLSDTEQKYIILQKLETANAQMGAKGQATREAGEYTNQVGELSDNIKMLKANIGSLTLPIVLQVTTKLSEITKKLSDKLGDVNDKASLAHRISERLTTMMKRADDRIESIVKKAKDLTDKVGGISKALKILKDVALIISGVAVFDKMNTGLSTLSKTLSISRSKLMLIIGAIALLVIVIQDIWGFMHGQDSLFGDILKRDGIDVDEVRKKITNAIKDIKAVFEPAIQGIKNALKPGSIGKGAGGIITRIISDMEQFMIMAGRLVNFISSNIGPGNTMKLFGGLILGIGILKKFNSPIGFIIAALMDLFNFIKGKDSLIGSVLSKAGVNVDDVRDKIKDGLKQIAAALKPVLKFIQSPEFREGILKFADTALSVSGRIILTLTKVVDFCVKHFGPGKTMLLFGGLLAIGKFGGGFLSGFVGSLFKTLAGGMGKGIMSLLFGTATTGSAEAGTLIVGKIGLIQKAFMGLGKLLPMVGTGILTVIKTIGAAIVANPVIAIIAGIVVALIALYKYCKPFHDFVNKIGGMAVKAFKAVGGAIKNVANDAKDAYTKAGGGVKGTLAAAGTVIKGAGIAELKAAQLAYNGINKLTGGRLGKAVTPIFKNIQSGANNVKRGFQMMSVQARAGWKGVQAAYKSGGVKGAIGAALRSGNAIARTQFGLLNTLTGGAVGKMVNTVRSKLRGFGPAIKNGMSEGISFISGLPGKFLTWGSDMIGNLISGIKSGAKKVGDAIGGVAKKIKDNIHFSKPDEGPLKDFDTYGPDMMQNLAEGISKGKPSVIKQIRDVSGEISTGIKGGKHPITSLAARSKGIKASIANGAESIRETANGITHEQGVQIIMAIRSIASMGTVMAKEAIPSQKTYIGGASSQKNVKQTNIFNNSFTGTPSQAEAKVVKTMKKSTTDATTQLARGFAFAR